MGTNWRRNNLSLIIMPATKLFISHASEDKTHFVEPLVEALCSNGFEVWYDKYELTIGDSLLKKISQGLQECDYGVVVLSPDFFRKKWTRAELDGLFAIESAERKVILPIWKDVSVEEVTGFSPILAGRLGVSTTEGIEYVVAQIRRAVEAADRVASFSSIENTVSRFRSLDQEIGGTKRAKALASSFEGVRVVADAAKGLLSGVRESVVQLAGASMNIEIKIVNESDFILSFDGSYRLRFVLSFKNDVSNSVEHAKLFLRICQLLDPFGYDLSKRKDLCFADFVPDFHHTGTLKWCKKPGGDEFTTEQLQIRVIEEIVGAFKTLHDQEVAKRTY